MLELSLAPQMWLIPLWVGYPTPDQWRRWADLIILKEERVNDWLIALSLAQDSQQAVNALATEVDINSLYSKDALRDSGLGYYWIRYQSAQIDLSRCLSEAGCYADRFETSVACEEIFYLLNQHDRGINIEKASCALFEPYLRLAEHDWRKLQALALS